MENHEIFERLKTAIIDGDDTAAQEYAAEVLKADIDPLEAVEEGLSSGMTIVGERFETGEAFLPELLMAAETFNAAMEIIKPALESKKMEVDKVGTVVIGSVKGDVHNIGKNIVGMVMEIHGFNVIDLGVDVSTLDFIEKAEKVKADVIALSAIMTTTMPYQQEVIEILKEKNLRDKYLVIVGGGPVTQDWVDAIGADAYGRSAINAVEEIKRLMEK
jgi:corrinoid protein of di/trimethylamine methyltransferase